MLILAYFPATTELMSKYKRYNRGWRECDAIGLRSEEESTERRAVHENIFLSGSSECCNLSPDRCRIEMVIIDRGIGTSCLSRAPGRGVSGTDSSLLCQGYKF